MSEHILFIACCASGLAVLSLGVFRYWNTMRKSKFIEQAIDFAPVLVSAPLAIFAMEHLLAAKDLSTLVPSWMPFPLFWTYFVGVALLAAALSLAGRRLRSWSALLLASLFLVFIVTIHVPNLFSHWRQRLFWTIALRDLLFACGTLVYAASCWCSERWRSYVGPLQLLGRVAVFIVLVDFAFQHFVFPSFAPGVPLAKLTPSWVPLPWLWAYLTGALLLVSGLGFLREDSVRIAAVIGGGVLGALTLFLYLPILLMEIHTASAMQGINYVADTLLAAGAVLLVGSNTCKGSDECRSRDLNLEKEFATVHEFQEM
jgi:uncharacterized membrane protein